MQVVLKRKLMEKSVSELIDLYKKMNHLECLYFVFFFLKFLSLLFLGLFALKCVFFLGHKHVIES